ncbi:hypothetical protein FB565_000217 [Actinoplanes lutulentus]|uniref:ParB-like nuclease family protein n=1 Tax=Actinoplanes lutulentus TaxID=1287878 RepID=A0A327YXZ3_9ACTN|nr:hypothetical protein [Actinoplanes lutulentus]MBB2940513.1 hypothetical protein [Actinoplanes lutulentus]RAK25495.1 hypothetical protein B0I29_13334 [Actinoplanes lutulentus]
MSQWFSFGPWAFSIDAAEAAIAARHRPIQPIPVDAWASFYGLKHLGDPRRSAAALIGPTSDALDREYAMTADLANPVIVAQLLVENQPAPLLIDGTHRLYRAWREKVSELPAYVLTVEETLGIRHPVSLGPCGITVTAASRTR